MARQGRIEVVPREYQEGDLDGAALAIAATNASEVNMRVKGESKRLSIPLNVADRPDLGDFIVPAVVRKGRWSWLSPPPASLLCSPGD